MTDPYQNIAPLIGLKSDLTDHILFHQQVNKSFHDIEAKYYDQIHQDMWKTLPEQFSLMVNDLMKSEHILLMPNTRMLDIGCGTGLSTDLLLKTPIGTFVSDITLLDTSSEMLAVAEKLAKNWNKSIKTIEGEIVDVQETFDLILISSVLHHIPDLDLFLKMVAQKLNASGILLTIHDPLHEAISSSIYRERVEKYQKFADNKKRNLFYRAFHSINRRILKAQEPNFIQETNEVLLRNNIIHTPLTEIEIWSITDIHVEDLPYSNKQGISLLNMKEILQDMDLVSYRTYAFFGTLKFNLNSSHAKKEEDLTNKRDQHGRNFSSLWIKGKTAN